MSCISRFANQTKWSRPLVLALSVSAFGQAAFAQDKQDLKLAVMGPLSGPYVAYGDDWRSGVQLAISEANAAGGCGGHKLVEVPADDQGSPAVGVTIANRMLSEDVFAVMGPVFSGVALSVGPVLERGPIPSFIGGSQPAITDRGLKAIFRIAFRDDASGPADAKTAMETMGAKKVVVIHDNQAMPKGLADEFVKAFKAMGGEILSEEVIDPNANDYTPTLTKIKSLNPDMVYATVLYPQGGLIIKQAKEIGLYKPGSVGNGWLFGNGDYDPAFIKLGGDATEGVLVNAWPSPMTDPGMSDYLQRYRATYNTDPSSLGHWGYDAVQVVCAAVTKVGADRQAVVDYLHSPEFSLKGVSGDIQYNEKGDRVSAPLASLIIKDGKYTVFQGQ